MSSFFSQNAKSIDKIIERAMRIMDFTREGELAKCLNVKHGTFSTWKKRQSVPYDHLLAFCEKESINFHWLITGVGSPRLITDHMPAIGNMAEKKAELTDGKALHPTMIKIVEMLKDMPEEDLKNIEADIEKAADQRRLRLRVTELEKIIKNG